MHEQQEQQDGPGKLLAALVVVTVVVLGTRDLIWDQWVYCARVTLAFGLTFVIGGLPLAFYWVIQKARGKL